jgi:hypothetical protein
MPDTHDLYQTTRREAALGETMVAPVAAHQA